MTIQFKCECGQKFSVPEEYAGKKSKCIKCKTIISIPNLPQNQETKSSSEIPANTKEKTKRTKSINHSENENEATKECPYCAKRISTKAKECEFCGEPISVSKRAKSKNNSKSILKYQKVKPKMVMFYTILTLGIYHLFFVHRVYKELKRRRLTKTSPMRAVWLFFVPFYNLVWAFLVWHEIGNAIEHEYRDNNDRDVNYGLIKNWPIGFFIIPFTLFLGTPILIIVMAIAFARTQDLLNQLPDLTESDENRKLKPDTSLIAKLCFYFTWASVVYSFITGIPSILLAHLALKDAKNGTQQEKQKAVKSISLAYGITIASTILWLFLQSIYLSKIEKLERKNQSIIQLQTINTYATIYENNFKQPIQSFDDILKLKEASSKAFISPLSKLPYVYFPSKNVAAKNNNAWLKNGIIWVYEEIPDSQGNRIYLGKNHQVIEIPETEFQTLLKNEIKLYGPQ